MKLPKGFKPDKNLDGKTQKFIDQKYRHEVVKEMLDISKKEFKKFNYYNMGHPDCYNACMELAESMDYNKFDLQELVLHLNNFDIVRQLHLGVYVSALVNKIIKEQDTIELTFNTSFDCLGSSLEQGYLEINGNVGTFLGHSMSGGMITVNGNADDYVGYCMADGNILVKGNAGNSLGAYKKGGQITIEGNYGAIHHSWQGDGKFSQPGVIL